MDQKVRPLYERGVGCRVIGEVLGEYPAMIYKRVRRMGIGRPPEEAQQRPLGEGEFPFSNKPCPSGLRRSALGTAIRWFLDRGYMASIPIEPVAYDLVVESDVGYQRVQVKTTNTRSKNKKHWAVGIYHRPYDSTVPLNAGGKRRQTAYTKEEIDLFFIVTGDFECFLVPLSVTGKRINITLDKRFDKFKCGCGGTVDPVGSEPASH